VQNIVHYNFQHCKESSENNVTAVAPVLMWRPCYINRWNIDALTHILACTKHNQV